MDPKSYRLESFGDGRTKFGEESRTEISTFRRYLPQFLSSCPISLMLANIGVALSFPTLVVQAFLVPDNRTDNLPTPSFFGNFTMDKEQTSLYVSIYYLCQPLGSIMGGLVIGQIGRKKLMLIFSFPILAGWLLLFFSQQVSWMYAAGALLGIGIGTSEAPIATYVPECVEADIRGVLLGWIELFLTLAFLIPYLVALAVTNWRWMALVHCALPCFTFVVICFMPETPIWLISKGRLDDASESLKWLRGWVAKQDVQEELRQQVDFYKETNLHNSTATLPAQSTDKLVSTSSFKETVKFMVSSRMRRPFFLICFMFFLMYTSGMQTVRPFLVPVIKQLGVSGNPENASMKITLVGIIGSIMTFLIVKFTGKRFLSLSGLLACGVMTVLLALCKSGVIVGEAAFYFFCVVSFFTGSGVVPLPWILQGEIYPYRGRGFASGVSAAFSYVVGFVCTNTFISVSETIGLEGVFFLFAMCNFTGLAVVYFTLPETEGKTFEEIEQFYKDTEKRRD